MTEVSLATKAALIIGEWALPRPGMGLPDGWVVYPLGPGYDRPDVPPLERRCEAAVLADQLICRCIRQRGHKEEEHMVHP